jgi:uncharacterized protein YndB with AHSA1/START domain
VTDPTLAGDRVLHKEVSIRSPLPVLWHMWTTEEGLRFASEASRVNLEPGGAYAWFLDLDPDESDRRGSEGSTIVSVTPLRELVFDWTFPPTTPRLRSAGATTRVTVRFLDANDTTTVTLTATGWGDGDEWDAGYDYFDRAWDYVLDRCLQVAES